ncbi:MAG: hypothetical protein PHT07_09665 [Paludibacter sp.]|nr:hypothetical protein [Paludibacter sp.]
MTERIYKHLRDIFKESVVDGLKEFLDSFSKLRTYLFGSIGAFYSTKEKLFRDINNEFTIFLNDSPWIKAVMFFFMILFLLFVYYQLKQFFVQAWRKWILIKRESIYGNAIVLLSKGYSKVNKNRHEEISIDEVKGILVDFCDRIRDIYEFKTKSKCSVSIKTIIDLNEEQNGINFNTRVVNLCRDSKSKKRYDNEYNEIEHTIANNSCYQKIISKFFSHKHEDMYFMCNDIIALQDYENSSFLLYPEFNYEIRENESTRRSKWPLNYRSELVVSISPLEKESKSKHPIVGFLCVDCELEKKEVFNSYYDVPLLLGVADGLYDFIKLNLYKTQKV